MKKIFLVAAMVLGFAVAASAQPKALGARLGYGAEISYQHTLGGANFLEADLGIGDFNYFNCAVVYNFMLAQPNWTDRGEWGFYLGAGGALATPRDHFRVGIAGQCGLEYTFWFPLQLSIDLRPQLDFIGSYGGLCYGWAPHLGVRYRF